MPTNIIRDVGYCAGQHMVLPLKTLVTSSLQKRKQS